MFFNTRKHEKKSYTIHQGMRGEGSIGPPSGFQSIQPIDMKFGMCNKSPVYFQISIVMWHLIGFHGNRNIDMTFPSVKIVFFEDIYPIVV